ncbi:WD40-repeat-containing domain protein [Peziza echinospora]|nr:WD40-repeat-containing domain protein [Peziza echinospora]
MPAKEPRFNLPRLEMSPPNMKPWTIDDSLSPLHMSPPAMLLPNFSPPHFKMPTLSASKYFPPGSLWDEHLPKPPTVTAFSPLDPTLLVVGTHPNEALGDGKGSIMFFRAKDHEGEVRGDSAFPPDPTRKKYVPDLKLIKTFETSASVMDVVFAPGDMELLIAVTAVGSIIFFDVPTFSDSIKRLSIQDPFPDHPAILSVACSLSHPSLFGCALINGNVALFEFKHSDSGISCTPKQHFQAHQGAARAIKFALKSQRLYTGGDDCVLRAWSLSSNSFRPTLAWQEDQSHDSAITTIQAWPYIHAGDKDRKRKLLLTGTSDGKFRAFDLSERIRPPPLIQTLDLGKEAIWRLDPLPALPVLEDLEKVKNGAFSQYTCGVQVKVDPQHAGLVCSTFDGVSRVLLQRQKFSSVFILKRDPDGKEGTPEEFDRKNRTKDGVEKDWYGREKEFEWYNVVEFKEHEGKVSCGSGVPLIDLDSIYKTAGKQNKRRGFRICSASLDDQKLCFYQVHVD